jgi:hypothetical protein
MRRALHRFDVIETMQEARTVVATMQWLIAGHQSDILSWYTSRQDDEHVGDICINNSDDESDGGGTGGGSETKGGGGGEGANAAGGTRAGGEPQSGTGGGGSTAGARREAKSSPKSGDDGCVLLEQSTFLMPSLNPVQILSVPPSPIIVLFSFMTCAVTAGGGGTSSAGCQTSHRNMCAASPGTHFASCGGRAWRPEADRTSRPSVQGSGSQFCRQSIGEIGSCAPWSASLEGSFPLHHPFCDLL